MVDGKVADGCLEANSEEGWAKVLVFAADSKDGHPNHVTRYHTGMSGTIRGKIEILPHTEEVAKKVKKMYEEGKVVYTRVEA